MSVKWVCTQCKLWVWQWIERITLLRFVQQFHESFICSFFVVRWFSSFGSIAACSSINPLRDNGINVRGLIIDRWKQSGQMEKHRSQDGQPYKFAWPSTLALYWPWDWNCLGLPIPGPWKRLMLEGVVKQNMSNFFYPLNNNTPLSPLSKPDTAKGSANPLASSFILNTVENKNISVTD